MHLLPDGRRVTYGKNGVIIGTAPVGHVGGHGQGQGQGQGHGGLAGLGNRINPAAYMQPSNSALTNSFLNAGHQQNQPTPAQQLPDDRYEVNVDTACTSNPTSAYGSPPGPAALTTCMATPHTTTTTTTTTTAPARSAKRSGSPNRAARPRSSTAACSASRP
jgi:hypothetical protein